MLLEVLLGRGSELEGGDLECMRISAWFPGKRSTDLEAALLEAGDDLTDEA